MFLEGTMINKICKYLTKKIKKEMPEITETRLEIIEYGLELTLGEIPKIVLLFAIGFALKIGWLVIFAYITMTAYKLFAGGFHLKTNLGCTIGTLIVYLTNVLISQRIIIKPLWIKYITIIALGFFSIIMISIYAPADTINVPILQKKERKNKKLLSYITMIILLSLSIVIKNNTISNILIINVLIESVSISNLAYKIFKNQYGYKTYLKINDNIA